MIRERIEGDCLEVMPGLPRRSCDLLLTDPPYALPVQYAQARNAPRRWSDWSVLSGWWRIVMERALPLLTPEANVAVFCGAPGAAAMWPAMHERLRNLQMAVWDKGRIGPGRPLRRQAEFLVVGSVGGRPYARTGGVGTVLRCPAVPPARRSHPAQKPVELLRALARELCPPGGAVLDPFAGSFSTEEACRLEGLRCTSIEWGEA